MINCLTQIINLMLDEAISGPDTRHAIDVIVANIVDDDVVISLVAYDNWMVRASVAKFVSGRSYEQLVALERDDDERVREVAIERHASDLNALAGLYTTGALARIQA